VPEGDKQGWRGGVADVEVEDKERRWRRRRRQEL
jgi:hypothetical protein